MGDSKIDTAVSLEYGKASSLKELCELVLEKEVCVAVLTKSLNALTPRERENAIKLLSLEMPLDLVLPVVFDEIYWSRRCISNNCHYVHYWINDCSWRDTFVFYFVENSIDKFLSRKTSFGVLANGLVSFQKYLKKLKVNGYKGNVDRDDSKIVCGTENISFQDFVSNLFAFFSNVEEVYLNIAPARLVIDWGTEKETAHQNLFQKLFLLRRLSKLTIIGYSLTKEQLSVITDNIVDSKIKYLNLSCNQLSNSCCHILSRTIESSRIEKLVLGKNCIGSEGVAEVILSLTGSKHLKSLDLSKNCIGDPGGKLIAEFLEDSTLSRIDLSFNELGHEAGLSFVRAIKKNTMLSYLNLSGNKFGKAIGESFAESVSANTVLLFVGVELCGFEDKDEDAIFERTQRNRENNGDDGTVFLR